MSAATTMKPHSFIPLALAVLFSAVIFAQQPQRATTRIGYVYPAGGQKGTTFTVSVGGQNLTGASAAYFSGSGVQARVTGYDRPLTQKEVNDLRERMQALQEKRAAGTTPLTTEEQKEIADIREKLASRPNRQANPALSETVTLEVTIAADIAPGERELRLKSTAGLSNPLVFCVGTLPEFSEAVVTATMNPPPRRGAIDPRSSRPKPTTLEIVLPANVNGQVLPGEVDRFHFVAQKDQRLTVAVSARALLPYLADAVPGWFQATLALFDAQGREVAYDDDFRFNPDPVLSYLVPADGDYTIEIKDSIYRGREDFVYRIAIGELPFVTSVFPLGAVVGGRPRFDLSGWNLPAKTLALDTKDMAPRRMNVRVNSVEQSSNSITLMLDAQPEMAESEPNNDAGHAQAVTLPMLVNGRIAGASDEDVFQFDGEAGTEIVAEIFARRLNSPLDSLLELSDTTGKRIASNDDYEDRGAALLTHHADSRISLKLPATGTYLLRVADAQHQGGTDFGYRLRIGELRPDFELRVVPSTINARAGTHIPVTVYALRRDGFAGEIALALRNAPRGFALAGARIPAGQDKVTLTLYVPPALRDEPIPLALVGTATIGTQRCVRAAVPAEDMMQAFAYHHLVPTKELLVNVSGRGGVGKIISGAPVRFEAPGSTARLELGGVFPREMRNVHAELRDAPDGITLRDSRLKGDTLEVILACDLAKTKPGMQGNLLLEVFGERPAAPNAKTKTKTGTVRAAVGTFPAIPFEVSAAVHPPTGQ